MTNRYRKARDAAGSKSRLERDAVPDLAGGGAHRVERVGHARREEALQALHVVQRQAVLVRDALLVLRADVEIKMALRLPRPGGSDVWLPFVCLVYCFIEFLQELPLRVGVIAFWLLGILLIPIEFLEELPL